MLTPLWLPRDCGELRTALRRAPSDPAGPVAPLQEAAGGEPGTCPVQLQVDSGVAVLPPLGGSAGPVFLLSAPQDSSHLLEWRQLGAFAKPKGQRRAAQPAMVVADALRRADGSRGLGGGGAPGPPPPPRPGWRHTRSLIPRPPLPRRRPRRAGDALTASRWSPAEASAAHNAPRAAIPLQPSPARPALCGPHANTGRWGAGGRRVLRGRGPGGGGGHAPPRSLQAASPHFSECAPQIL